MPHASRYTPEVVQEILDRLLAGETIADICRTPRMPSRSGFSYWRRTRREFDQNLIAMLALRTLRWPPRRRRSPCTPELTARIAGQLETGRSLYAICRDPGMPTCAAAHSWLATRPEFARGVAAAMPWTRAGRARRGRPDVWSERLGEQVCARLAQGEPLARICADATMPSRRTVQRWLKTQPRFRGRYAAARVIEYHRLLDHGLDLIESAGPGEAREQALRFKLVRFRVAAMDPHIAQWRSGPRRGPRGSAGSAPTGRS